jgi:hypothetical protein
MFPFFILQVLYLLASSCAGLHSCTFRRIYSNVILLSTPRFS